VRQRPWVDWSAALRCRTAFETLDRRTPARPSRASQTLAPRPFIGSGASSLVECQLWYGCLKLEMTGHTILPTTPVLEISNPSGVDLTRDGGSWTNSSTGIIVVCFAGQNRTAR